MNHQWRKQTRDARDARYAQVVERYVEDEDRAEEARALIGDAAAGAARRRQSDRPLGGWGTGDWRKNRTASSLADDTSFETRESSDFVKPSVLTPKEKNARLCELVHGYSERHEASGAAARTPPAPMMVEMKASAPPTPTPTPQRQSPAAAQTTAAATSSSSYASSKPHVIPASSPSAMLAYEKMIAAEAAAAAAAVAAAGPGIEAAAEAETTAAATTGFTVPELPKPSKSAAEAALRAVYGDEIIDKAETKNGWKWPSLFFKKNEEGEEEKKKKNSTADAADSPIAAVTTATHEENTSTYEAGRVVKIPRETTKNGEVILTAGEKTGMGVSAAAVGLASAAAAFSGEFAVVTVSAAAILGMFAERNLRYPEDRERLAAALKSRAAFEAFIVSGAGMLDFDGAAAAGQQLGAPGDEYDRDDRYNLRSGDDLLATTTTAFVTPVLAADSLTDEADALEKLRSEIAAQYRSGGEVEASARESMQNLGLTSMEISRWGTNGTRSSKFSTVNISITRMK